MKPQSSRQGRRKKKKNKNTNYLNLNDIYTFFIYITLTQRIPQTQ